MCGIAVGAFCATMHVFGSASGSRFALWVLVVQAITAAGVIVALFQLVVAARSHNVEALLYLHQYLTSDELVAARRLVRTVLYAKELSDWTGSDKAAANQVCASYDQAGLLIEAGLLKRKHQDLFLGSSWGESICDQYEALAEFLDAPQTLHQTGRNFFRHFGALYRLACATQKRTPIPAPQTLPE